MAGIAPRGVEAPVIETERLRLRGHRPEDFAVCTAMWADPVVTRYIGGKPLSEEDVWARTLRYLGHWAWLGFGYWVMEENGIFRLEAGDRTVSERRAGTWVGACHARPWEGSRNGSGAGRDRLGRFESHDGPARAREDGVHHSPRAPAVDSRSREVRIQRSATHGVQRRADDFVCAIGALEIFGVQ
jgi:hypothetical protein